MFTLQAIQDTHSKVKSWADFPQYIKELIQLWITSYSVFVFDWHAEYFGKENYSVISPTKYDLLNINIETDKEWFMSNLKLHQQWGSDYMTFCKHAADAGIIKRVIEMDNMTCSYYDSNNIKILVENIPSI